MFETSEHFHESPEDTQIKREKRLPFEERVLMYQRYVKSHPVPKPFDMALRNFANSKNLAVQQLNENDFIRFVHDNGKLVDEVCNTDDPACVATYAHSMPPTLH